MFKTSFVAAVTIAGLASQLQAQSLPVGSHYPVGAEGIKGAALPPPGLYVRDYNFFYTADKVDGLPVDIDVFAYVQAPRVIWITDQKILGADYGMDLIVPFAYKDVSLPWGDEYQFNLADIQVEPLLLSWHFQQFDVAAGYAVWVPTGNYDGTSALNSLTSPGSGFWSQMITLGGVWYPDEKKTWAMSLLGRYEICHEQDDTHVTPGNMATVEWGFSKTVMEGVDVGLIGYYQQQTTEDDGRFASSDLSHVVGVGPEVNVLWSKIGLISSLRYAYEAEVKDRPQGHLISLTLTRRF